VAIAKVVRARHASRALRARSGAHRAHHRSPAMSSAAGSTAPQFVSQRELSDSQKRREKEIREAYARYVDEAG